MNSDSRSESRPRLRARLRDATNEAILAAAEDAFGAVGLAGVRMEDIAAGAGVAVGTLYNHFEDRSTLWRELVRTRRAALLARLEGAVEAGRGEPFPGALATVLRALFAHWEEHRGFMAVLLQSEPSLHGSPREATPKPFVQEIVARLGRVVKRGVAEGALRADGADLFPAALLGMARSLLLLDLGGSAERPLAAQVDLLVELFLRGASTRP